VGSYLQSNGLPWISDILKRSIFFASTIPNEKVIIIIPRLAVKSTQYYLISTSHFQSEPMPANNLEISFTNHPYNYLADFIYVLFISISLSYCHIYNAALQTVERSTPLPQNIKPIPLSLLTHPMATQPRLSVHLRSFLTSHTHPIRTIKNILR